MPFLASMMKQMPPEARKRIPADFDPNAPLIQMTQELVELSSEPWTMRFLWSPRTIKWRLMEEILKSAIPAVAPPFKQ